MFKAPSSRLAPVALLLLALVLATFAVPPAAAEITKDEQDPTASDSHKTLNRAAMSAATPPLLSGIDTIQVRSTYQSTGTPVGTETMRCDAVFRYTFDGTVPSASSPSLPMPCEDPDVPASPVRTYVVDIPPATWTNATPGAIITFRIEVPLAGVPEDPDPYIDNNGNLFYKFRIDKSAARFTQSVPNLPAGASTDTTATQDETPPLSFVLQDDPLESPIVASTLVIDINQEDRTDQFDCDFPTTHRIECAFDYAQAGTGFSFALNQVHTMEVKGNDQALNPFNATLKFRVERAAPAITGITAVPNSSTPGGPEGRPITARGVNVTVKATVNDASMNTNSQTSVFAQLFNTTRGAVSALAPMKFNQTSSKWETNASRIPENWPEGEFRVDARVFATDLAGNVGSNETTNGQFVLDPVPPVVTDTTVAAFHRDVPVKIRANAKDTGSGVDPDTVILRYSNQTGSFKAAPPAGHTKVDNKTFEVKMAREGTSENYTADIPAANGGATITYFVSAKDKAGGLSVTPARLYSVDLAGPIVTESLPAPFRGQTPHTFTFEIQDAGSGVNASTAKLFYAVGSGSFASQALARVGTSNSYTASISPSVTDGANLRYYVEALDLLGNRGNLSSASSPSQSKIDLVAPTFTLSSPPTASGQTFLVTWNGTDANSGVQSYTIQARVQAGGATPGDWVTILNSTTLKSLDFCGEGGRTYQFRGWSTDRAGNSGTPPAEPMAATVLSGTGCPEGVTVRVTSPATAQVINGLTSTTFNVLYQASSTRSFTPAESLRLTIEFSPDNGAHWFVQSSTAKNTGSYALAISELPSCTSCLVKITAASLSGASGVGTSGEFQIRDGSKSADLDQNGLADTWELSYGGALGARDPGDDDDRDGLDNAEESAAGTNPDNKDTDGDGASDRVEVRSGTNPLDPLSVPTAEQARTQEFTHWYWSIPALFGATAVVFFVGLARRW